MLDKDIERLRRAEARIKEIAQEWGLITTEIDFEIVPAQRMFEAMGYRFPMNFSHWSFGRDFEKHRTIYEHTGQGIPYEQVWNFERPRAFLVETNPIALNILVIAHVYGHVDYFLRNRYLLRGRSFSDIAREARNAAARFREYEAQYGKEEVEKTIDAGMSIQWQQHADPFLDEELDDDVVRAHLVELEKEKLKDAQRRFMQEKGENAKLAVERAEQRIRHLEWKTPPLPVYDLLGYIIKHSPILKSWQRDVLSVIRNQARVLAPNARTKMLNEGWATYWHVRIMRRLFEEGFLTPEEHGVFNRFHSGVTRESKASFNWYRNGLALFEYIKDRWDRGRFGREYDECTDLRKRAGWDTGVGEGTQKIFEVASIHSDRMAVEEFFTDEFIRGMKLYFYEKIQDPDTGAVTYTIVENRPEEIRRVLKQWFALHGIEFISIADANYENRHEFYLLHESYGLDLDAHRRNGALENLFYLWGRRVHLETVKDEKPIILTYNGKEHKSREKK